MREEQHEAIARWERRWLAVAGVLLVVFVVFIAYSLALEGRHIAHATERGTPEELVQREPFARPGVVETEPGRYQVGVRAQAFSFTPADVRIPAGAETTFYLTSQDVLHGFQVQNTSINVELIPGDVSVFSYTFERPGRYRVTCNEYCGIGHQNMLGTITVLDPRDFERERQEAEAAAAEAGADGPEEASLALGREVYADNCAGCHQAEGEGVQGAFPPLAGHAVDLLSADGGRDYLVNVMLYGLEGQIEAEGVAYDGVMPAWGQLEDEEVAGVLNHVLTAWGNDERRPEGFEPYDADEIAPYRDESMTPQEVLEERRNLELAP